MSTLEMLPTVIKAKVTGAFMSVFPLPVPETFSGAGCVSSVGALCKKLNLKKILVVTDDILPGLGLLDSTYDSLKSSNVEYIIFDKVMPDPTSDICVEGCKFFLENKCDGVIAFGGGSSMDCAKFIIALATSPSSDPKSFAGAFRINPLKAIPPFIAIPTTAGTGSEATLAAVISFPKEQRKYSVMAPQILPKYAYLDPLLIEKLPKAITAATGMDALTHAVESYLSSWRTDFTAKYSLSAVKGIFENLKESYDNGSNLEAREKMLIASFEAGVAFTRASVGYVHAIAHQLGGLFHVPHGVANAMILHKVLDFFLEEPSDNFILEGMAKLQLAAEGNVNGSPSASEMKGLAAKFAQSVKKLTQEVEIPTYARGLDPTKVELVVDRAIAEAHGNQYPFFQYPMQNLFDGGYPVPKFITKERCTAIVSSLVDPTLASKL